MTNYLGDGGYEVQWYDLSYDAGRQANGTMHMNIVAKKYKLILHIRPLTLTQFQALYSNIAGATTYTVQFLDPFSGQYKTINCYRGDRTAVMKWNRTDVGILFDSTDMELIEL